MYFFAGLGFMAYLWKELSVLMKSNGASIYEYCQELESVFPGNLMLRLGISRLRIV